MKVKVIKNAYYNLEYLKAGQVIDYKGDKLPSWATLANGVETKKEKITTTFKTPVELEQKDKSKTPETNSNENDTDKVAPTFEIKTETKEADTIQEKTGKNVLNDAEKQQYLNLLLDESVEKNILIENTDKKTVDEQIAELEHILNKEGK